MKIYKVEPPKGLGYGQMEQYCLDEDIKDLKLGFDSVFYWYLSGYYEGCGNLLGHLDGKWYLFDLAHCSCYGPLDQFDKEDHFEYKMDSVEPIAISLDAIKPKCSDEYWKEVEGLIKKAKDKGYY